MSSHGGSLEVRLGRDLDAKVRHSMFNRSKQEPLNRTILEDALSHQTLQVRHERLFQEVLSFVS